MAKVLISIPDDLLERIDRAARAGGSSRSRFLREAALRQLDMAPAAVMDAALARGRAALAEAGRFESADLVRRQRQTLDTRDRRR